MKRARMDLNYSVVPVRPAGGVWTSARELAKYVEMELAKGMLPSGKRLVSAENLLARYKPNVIVGEDVTYGMALMVDTRYGIPVVHHGGDLAGYHSDMIWLPEHGVGAVILTNADSGRRHPRAAAAPAPRAAVRRQAGGRGDAEGRRGAAQGRHRQGARAPRRAGRRRPLAAKLAPRYVSTALGEVKVLKEGSATVFDVGEWRSAVASRRNDDGTVSFITIDPTLSGFEFVVADEGGQRRLVTRDAQHEYVFVEEKGTASKP